MCEIGNILGSSYLIALARDDRPVARCRSRRTWSSTCSERSSQTVLAQTSGHGDTALVLDSVLDVAGETCSISFMLLPTVGGVPGLLAPLGLAEPTA